ncbi:MAG: Smr/MutS family protein [Rhodoferax sp.]|nr:Smr/MutS family protein [Rhodoferax sp.]
MTSSKRSAAVKISSLTDLKAVKVAIEDRARKAAEAAARKVLEDKQRAAQRNLFQAAVGRVHALPDTGRVSLKAAPPAPIPRQQQLDDAAALKESLSDEVDIGSLLDTDERLSFLRPGVGPDVAQKLRRGKWTVQGQVDLHGLRSDEAREALAAFIRDAHRAGWRCVRVVHGKGLGSPGKTPVLKDKVHRWLVQKNEVAAFVQAQPAQGGAGALVVLLQPAGKS